MEDKGKADEGGEERGRGMKGDVALVPGRR